MSEKGGRDSDLDLCGYILNMKPLAKRIRLKLKNQLNNLRSESEVINTTAWEMLYLKSISNSFKSCSSAL